MTPQANQPVVEFSNCSYQVAKLPSEVFEKDSDKRKKHHNGRNRQLLMQKLASHADADGSHCFPAVETLAEDTNYSERQIYYYLADLEELGFVVKEGRRGESGPRVRKLVLPSEVQDRAQSKLQDRRERKRKIGTSKLQNRKAEMQDRGSELQDKRAELQSTLQTTRDQRPERDQKEDQTPQAAVFSSLPSEQFFSGKIQGLAEDFERRFGKPLDLAGQKELWDLSDTIPAHELSQCWEVFLSKSPRKARKKPFVSFASVLPSMLDDLRNGCIDLCEYPVEKMNQEKSYDETIA
jgi:hypothetical protein